MYKNMKNKMLILLSFLFVSACFPLTGYGLKEININDDKEQVIKKIGRPYTKKSFYNKEYMVYYVYDDIFSLFFNIKRFPYVGFYPLLRTGEEYWIVLENNKVVAVASARNLNNYNIPKALDVKGGTVEVVE